MLVESCESLHSLPVAPGLRTSFWFAACPCDLVSVACLLPWIVEERQQCFSHSRWRQLNAHENALCTRESTSDMVRGSTVSGLGNPHLTTSVSKCTVHSPATALCTDTYTAKRGKLHALSYISMLDLNILGHEWSLVYSSNVPYRVLCILSILPVLYRMSYRTFCLSVTAWLNTYNYVYVMEFSFCKVC